MNMASSDVPRSPGAQPPLKRQHSLKSTVDSGLWTLARRVCAARLVIVLEGLVHYRNLSSTVNDPQCRPQMFPKGKLEWLGLKLLDHRVMFIITTKSIKRNKFDFANNCKKESNNCKTTFKTLFNQ